MPVGLLSLHYPLACPFKGMFSSNGSLPAETSPHLLLGAWCEDAAVLGERRVSVDVLEFLTQLIWGSIFRVEKIYQKSHLLPHIPRAAPYALFPWTSVINPESRFSPSLKGDRLYRIPDLTVAHPRDARWLYGGCVGGGDFFDRLFNTKNLSPDELG